MEHLTKRSLDGRLPLVRRAPCADDSLRRCEIEASLVFPERANDEVSPCRAIRIDSRLLHTVVGAFLAGGSPKTKKLRGPVCLVGVSGARGYGGAIRQVGPDRAHEHPGDERRLGCDAPNP
jgi:hypothetical protein